MKTNYKRGIAMIELIFSLVIIALTLMSAPMLISQSTKGSVVTFQQESIAIAAAHTSALMTYAWDENNTRIENSTNILRVNPSINTDSELDFNVSDNKYRGLVAFSFPDARSRRFTTGAAPWSATQFIGVDINDTDDDIDDFIANTLSTSISSDASNQANEGEYMDITISINNKIMYVNDKSNYTSSSIDRPNFTEVNTTTNIKWLTTTLTSDAVEDKRIVLQAFMCNIGSPIIQNKNF